MLQIKHLTITHKKDLRVILEDFSFALNKGDKAAIIGEEGNGKSTLLKWIYNSAFIETYAEASGEKICNQKKIGYLPQELPEIERDRSIYEFFLQEPLFLEQTPKQLGKLAKDFHLSLEFFYGEQKMRTLSGGEKVKAQMMRLLLGEPSILLLDEPSNDIDIGTLGWLEQMIRNTEQPVLFISHDETLIERTANVIIHIEQIRRKTRSRYTVVHMSYDEYCRERNTQFEKQRQLALNEQREKRKQEEKLRKITQKVEHDQNAVSRQDPHGGRLLKKKMKAVKSMERRYEREGADAARMPEEETAIYFQLGEKGRKIPAGKTVLEFSLDRLYTPDNSRILAENICLRVRGAEKICIVGENGSGKTTLLKKIREAFAGRSDIKAIYMPQDYEDLLDMKLTPVDYLDHSGDKEERTRIRTFLGAMKYTADEMNHPIAELSGGQKAKILFLKMSLSDANVLVLDEPTRNFSPLSGPVIRKMLADYPGAIISISHDRKYIAEVCDKVYHFTNHGLVSEGESI